MQEDAELVEVSDFLRSHRSRDVDHGRRGLRQKEAFEAFLGAFAPAAFELACFVLSRFARA